MKVKMVSLAEIQAARARDCAWSEEMLADAIERIVPGEDPVNLADLITFWLDGDRGKSMLAQTAMLAAQLGGTVLYRNPFVWPRQCLEYTFASLPEE